MTTIATESLADITPDSSPQGDSADRLEEARTQFVALWGQMGSSWGIPRTMAELHALLFISPEPLNTDEIMERLGVSRGNASMTVRALLDWGIVRRVHRRGDRRDYFEAEQDILKLFRTILRERKKREFEPLIDALRECRKLTEGEDEDEIQIPESQESNPLEQHNDRLGRLLEFIEMSDAISEQVIRASDEELKMIARLFIPEDHQGGES